ncbi:uncharacterized protein VICG_01734 [Vittaforma corneae ATCC 50505]|uniref:Nop domain-containing protein n=1 Tax=Vittaforma corneae (strain ATCC 50505) TaxID=993615 RepID=L2GL66_VITCO|nr:uncharacterized protein VICG_01734 [Vittaforma corneae ATCC 50505]ELA41245.1 hypothetical protein VICG_01734 [Vittaforma corneae ATCC 50505]
MFYLLESVFGVALFKKNEEEIILLKKLLFDANANVVDIIDSLNEGAIPDQIKEFIKENCPLASTVNVLNPKICETLSRELSMNAVCSPDSGFRKLRTSYFEYFDVSKDLCRIATSKIAHRLIKTNRNDMILIDILNYVEEMDVSINNRIMRVREWYSIHFPELNTVSDSTAYLNLVLKIGSRQKFLSNSDYNGVPEEIVRVAGMSMGSSMKTEDIQQIKDDVCNIQKDIEYKNGMLVLMKTYAQKSFPNLFNIIGEGLAVRLIRKAGSISQLAQFASSTIQILGAEKAFNEAVKMKTNTPKYGLIFSHSLICDSPEDIRGRVARAVANKVSLCARIDSDPKNSIGGEFGTKARKEIEKLVEKLVDRENKKEKAIFNKKKRIVSVKEYDVSRDSTKRMKSQE